MRFISIDENTYYHFLELSKYSFKAFTETENCFFDVIADSFIIVQTVVHDGIGRGISWFIMMAGDVPVPFTAGLRDEILGKAKKKLELTEKTTETNRPAEP